MNKAYYFFIFLVGIFMSCTPSNDELQLQSFIQSHVAIVAPKYKALNIASWNASATGEKQYYDEQAALEIELRTIYSSNEDFEKLKKWKERGTISDPLLKRQLILLYNSYLPNQIDSALLRQIVEKSTAIASTFNTFRATLDGKEVSDNTIEEILRKEKNSSLRKKAWEASKQVGKVIAHDVIELVKLRNKAAQSLGFKNYYEMMLTVNEQNESELINLFDKLDSLTRPPFETLKQSLDKELAQRWGIAINEMRPWHYQDRFFQEVPAVGTVNFDRFFEGKNIEELGKIFYASIDLPVDDILSRSDLYERKGKYPHAFEIDVDRAGDVRVMLNIKDNERWMSTMLHELGHGVYSKYIDSSLPYLLRTEAHIFLTEAIAQLMERQARNAQWLQSIIGISDKEKEEVERITKETLRMKLLIFSRWSQVMVRFERAMYENPDQDLNSLWWKLVQQYQCITPPDNRNEPDWASKIHLSQVPVYYHNYLLGELTASQLQHTIAHKVLNATTTSINYYNKSEVGNYLREQIFMHGARYRWDDLIKRATGKPLTPEYFAEDIQ